ncbi:MAG: hypothetical protein V4696_10165 [Pseudomonadota bacterium]
MQSVYSLPLGTDNADPNRIGLEDAVERVEEELSAGDKLSRLANASGNIAPAMSAEMLVKIGIDCCDDYEKDKAERKDWADVAEKALDAAAQDNKGGVKDYPWKGASNIKFPLLTEAALQFNARMYPALVKGDEAILCKVIGQDNGRPVMAQNPQTGQMMPVPMMGQDGQPVVDAQGQMQPMFEVQPGSKAKRAKRVSEYLNTVLFYRMPDWESDTDALLMQLPIVGCVFRKQWWDSQTDESKSAMVPALRLLVPKGTKSLVTALRITEELPDVAYRDIDGRIRDGVYFDNDLDVDEEAQKKCRLLLEQHCYLDLDGDGFGEPYIVTLDHETRKVLRIEANYGADDIRTREDGTVVAIKKSEFYTKYGLFPHPKGDFYDLGLGHILDQLGDVINTAINQLMDAGSAQTAGGGFIGSGVRLQGGKSGVIRMMPGEYKTVPVSGATLRESIVERTLPNVSPVTFQVLDLIMGAAKNIAGAKDVITGDASNTGQVGTTLALIEQGLQVFNATAKRNFRSAKDEYTLLRDNTGKFGGEAAAQDYMEVLDDPEADFAADFSSKDMDIRPVSDPSSVTRMQKMAKGQFLMSTMEQLAAVKGDTREALRRVYEAADIEDIDKLLPPPQPQQPDPRAEAQAQAIIAKGAKDAAQADHERVKTAGSMIDVERAKLELERDALTTGMEMGANGIG